MIFSNDPVFLQLEGELSKPRVEYVIEKSSYR